MDAITYTEARNNLAKTMDKVNDNHAPIIITRQNGQPVVMMSLDDFEAWQETDYLLRSPANARRLMESIEQDRQSLASPHALVDLT
jgi:antitoxin YefM